MDERESLSCIQIKEEENCIKNKERNVELHK